MHVWAAGSTRFGREGTATAAQRVTVKRFVSCCSGLSRDRSHRKAELSVHDLFTFLDDPAVPADNNGTERDIRSQAAARSDGGTHRADWSAAAFARLRA
jgi:hypothetical protein